MNDEKWVKDFLRLHYEPEHIEGGVCWCGVTYRSVEGVMHIDHKEQRVILMQFIRELLAEACKDT